MAQVKSSFRSSLLALVIIYLAGVMSLIGNRIFRLAGFDERVLEATWSIFLILSLAGVALTGILMMYYLHSLYACSVSVVNDLRRLLSSQTKIEAILTQVSENVLLSDAVKSVAFREKDRIVLQGAIQQDIRKEQWESARLLIEELEKRFGCREEAQQLREELQRYRNATVQEKIATAIKHIESLWIIHHYDEALIEAEMLMELYCDDERVRSLKVQTEEHRQEHKRELFTRWDKVVKNNDVDQGVEILKLLDKYLTPSEAAALEESARGVFRAQLHNMGLQFSLFVTDKKWGQALKIGKQIIEEYPNTRMAQEVREKLDVLERRAAEQPV